MEEILMSTYNCYKGYDNKNKCYIVDNYPNLNSNENIDKSTIEFDNDAWNDEKEYFIDFIKDEIAKYEKRYKTNVIGVALIGTVGLWTGNHFGGKVYSVSSINTILNSNVDDIEVVIDRHSRVISIRFIHHDGTHRMKIYFITNGKLKKAKLQCQNVMELNNPDDLRVLRMVLTPIILSKNNKYFNI